MRHQAPPPDTSLLLDGPRQLGDHRVQLIQQVQQILPSRLTQGANRNDFSCSRPCSGHNLFLQRSPCVQSYRLQLVQDSGARLHHPVPGPQQLCADLGSLHSVPRSSEIDLPAVSAQYAAHPGDRPWACVLAWLESRRLRVGMEATGHARRFERMLAELNIELWVGDAYLLSLGSQVAIKTFPIPRSASTVALRNLQFQYPQTQFAGSPADNRIYNGHCPAPFYPSLHGWFWQHQVYSGTGAGVVMESIARCEVLSVIACRLRQLQWSDAACVVSGFFVKIAR